MKTVSKKQLNGFREPTQEEAEGIKRYVSKSSGKILAVTNIGIAFLSLVVVSAIINIISADGDRLVSSIFGVLTALLLCGVLKGKSGTKKYLNDMQDGKFEVLECIPYKLDFDTDGNSKTVAWVHNRHEQLCKDAFLIDRVTASEYSDRLDELNLLLMRCGNRYELFTDLKLGRK